MFIVFELIILNILDKLVLLNIGYIKSINAKQVLEVILELDEEEKHEGSEGASIND